MEIDLIDMTEEAVNNNGYRYGFAAIDTFTKMVSVQLERSINSARYTFRYFTV